MNARPTPTTPEAILAQEDFVRALALRLLGDPSAADDVAQETVLTALTRAPRSGALRLRSWMASVARNEARMTQRAEDRRRGRERAASRAEGSVPGPDEIAEREAARQRVTEAVLALEEAHREILILRYWEGLDPRGVAARLAIGVEAARTRLKRAHARLRAELARREGPEWRRAIAPVAWSAAGTGAGLGALAWKLAAGALVLVGGGAVLLNAPRPGGGGGGGPVDDAEVARAELQEQTRDEPVLAVPGEAGSARRPADVGGAATTTPARHLYVRVVDEHGEPIEGAELRIEDPEALPVAVGAGSWSTSAPGAAGGGAVAAPSSGSFEPAPAEPVPLRALGYGGPPPPALTLVTDETGRVRVELEEEAEGELRLVGVPTDELSTRGLDPRPWRTGRSEVRVVVPTMRRAKLTVEVRALDTGLPLEGYTLLVQRVWGEGEPRRIEVPGARVEVEVSVHPADPEGEGVFTGVMVGVEDPRIAPVGRTFAMQPGEERRLVLRHRWLEPVAGRVVDSAGKPVPDVTVAPGGAAALRGGSAYGRYERDVEGGARTDGKGRFHLLTAEKEVSAWHPEHGVSTAPARDDVTLVLSGVGVVSGIATDADGRPRAGELVRLDLFVKDETDEDGGFRFDGLMPGAHWVSHRGRRVKFEVRAGEETRIDLGGEPRPATVILEPALEGRVRLLGEGETCSLGSAEAGEEGFALDHLVPGTYWLVHGGELLVRADLVPGRQAVAVPRDGLEVTAPPGEWLRLHPRGLSRHLDDLLWHSYYRVVPPEGRVIWNGLQPGDYELRRQDGGVVPVTIGDGTAELELGH